MSARSRIVLTVVGVLLTAALLSFGIARAQDKKPERPGDGPTRELWLFFAPDQDLAADLRAVGKLLKAQADIIVRPCLLTTQTDMIENPSETFARTLKELQSLLLLSPSSSSQRMGVGLGLRIIDTPGLAFAKELGIDSLPAWALVSPPDRRGTRRARVAVGIGPNFKELLECK